MWIALALASALGLGIYDIFKKLSVKENNVLTVLLLNTIFSALLLSPIIIRGAIEGDWGFDNSLAGHTMIIIKAAIVLGSWILGYFAIKHLPLTIQGPINATRPVIVLVGAMLIFGERLNRLEWIGILLGFTSLFLISRIGAKEGFSLRHSRWLWMSIGAMALGAVSALYDKYLLRSFAPLEVQSWYALYQCLIMSIVITIIKRSSNASHTPFTWRWTIPCIAIFLTAADIAYFYSLSLEGSMISIVSMIRRGSVIIPFLYGVIILREKNVRTKAIDLSILLLSLLCLVAGATLH